MVLKQLFTIDSAQNGKGPTVCKWQPEGTYLAVAGANKCVLIVDRHGTVCFQFVLMAPCIALDWDNTGEVVAAMQERSAVIILYSVHTKKVEQLDTGLKDVCWMQWSIAGPQLAVASAKGAMLIYNRQTLKKVPIVGTHSKRILGGAWNVRNELVLVGEDKVLSLSDAEGAVKELVTLKSLPTSVNFVESGQGAQKDLFALVNLGGKSLFMNDFGKRVGNIELSFQHKYNNIVAATCFGDGYMLAAFSSGFVLVASMHPAELGNEISWCRIHRDSVIDMAFSRTLLRGASIGDNSLCVFDLDDNLLNEQKLDRFVFESELGTLQSVQWTNDGQILTVSTKTGAVYSFLTKIAVLSASCGSNILFLSSLRELTLRDMDTDVDVSKIAIDLEPSFVALGPTSAAVGMNNQVYYYTLGSSSKKAEQLGCRVYGGIVSSVHLSANHVAVMVDGRVVVHHLEQPKGQGSPLNQVTLPEKDLGKVVAIGMTDNLLYIGTNSAVSGSQTGYIVAVALMDFATVMEFHHSGGGIRTLAPNYYGTRVAFIDTSNAAYILNPTTEVLTTIENFVPATKTFLWDSSDYGTFVGCDGAKFTTYVYAPNTRYNSTCEGLANDTVQPYGVIPVMLLRGAVVCQLPSGMLASVLLQSHKSTSSTSVDAEGFENNLKLNRIQAAITCSETPEQLDRLAQRALHLLDVDSAIRIYRSLERPINVMSLERIRHLKEKNILIGHVCMMLGQFGDAQTYFLRSSQPSLALEMRRDLMQWDHALQLAKTMAVDQVAQLSKEYAQQLEFRGEYGRALELFQSAKMPEPANSNHMGPTELQAMRHQIDSHNEAVIAGAARCMLRVGNIRGGVQLAQSIKNPAASLECASILEQLHQYDEAAQMYDRAEQYEKAASIYISETKNLKAAGRLLPKITSRNILVLYARAKESIDGAYADAEQAYTAAEDWDNVIRIKVDYLNDLQGAFTIVRKTRSSEAATVVAKACKKKGEYGVAVEFLILAKKIPEAFDVAKQYNCMPNFEEALLAQVQLRDGVAPPASRDDFANVAHYYDQRGNNELAAQYYNVAANFALALDKYIAANTPESIDRAVAVIGKARSDVLTGKLIDFLMGEVDGEPKDSSYIFKLYMSLGNYEKAAKTAVMISAKEQELGNYRGAHRHLVETSMVLQEKKIRIPSDLRRSLLLLHSYLIVKHVLKPLNDADCATRLLLRVARNITRFPQHEAAILSSCAMQCIKADFKASAYEYSCILVQNDKYRPEIPEKHKKKIDATVRKRGKEDLMDPPEGSSPCPICNAPVLDMSLECNVCKNTLPFCIVTGKHMVVAEWCECSHCHFPALYAPLMTLLAESPQCPMCDKSLNPNNVARVTNPDVKSYI